MLEIKNLCYSHENGKKILNNIDFFVQDGEILGITGKVGSGKSTLAKILNTILRPTSGKVLLGKLNIHDDFVNSREAFFKIGLVFQHPEDHFFENTVYDEIAYGLRNKNVTENDIQKKIYNLAEKLKLNRVFLSKSPTNISGGEKRICAIAGILIMQPEVLILDDPLIGLDLKNRQNLIEILLNYHKEMQKKLIIISSSVEDILCILNKILVLEDGKQLYFGNITKNIKKYGFELPDVTKIMSNVSIKYPNINNDVFRVQDAVLSIREVLNKR